MNSVVAEPHFVPRDRMGRLAVFLGRQVKDGKTTSAWGVAVNEETSLIVNKTGYGVTVANPGGCCVAPIPHASADPVVYYVLLDHQCETITAGVPLTCTGLKVWKRTENQVFNLATRPTTNPDYVININGGSVSAVGNGGQIY